MAFCEKCHGTKYVRAFAPPSYRASSRGMAQVPKRENLPCPDCTPKPFAEALGNGVTVRFGEAGEEYDLFLNVEAHSYGQREAASALNTAVEAREVRLRGRTYALRMIAAEMGDAAAHLVRGFSGQERMVKATNAFREHMLESIDDADEYVSGHVACGLAWDMGVWQETVRDLSLMVDVLTESNPTERALIAPFLRAKGIAEQEPYEAIIHQLREALKVGINLTARSGGSSTLEFRQMTSAFDATATDLIAQDLKRAAEWDRERDRQRDRHREPPCCRDRSINGALCSLPGGHDGAHSAGAYTWRSGGDVFRLEPHGFPPRLTATEVARRDADRELWRSEFRLVHTDPAFRNDPATNQWLREVEGIIAGELAANPPDIAAITADAFGLAEMEQRLREDNVCRDRKCSRFNSRHRGIPCDVRRR